MNTSTLSELFNTDFCPSLNRYVYWLKKPLSILIVAAIASLLCGLFVAPQGLVIAGAIAATVALGMIWPWIGLQGLTCELRFSNQRGVEGQASSVEVVIRNRWPFPVWGLAIEDGFFLTHDNEDGTAAALSGIRGWSKTKFCWSYLPECRGVYPTTNAKIATEFPFGVWKVRRDIDTNGQLIVWPKTVSLEPAVLSDGANRSLLRSSDKKSGNEGERIGVRAYRDGDSLRFVHWAQTAKLDRLIVSETRASPIDGCGCDRSRSGQRGRYGPPFFTRIFHPNRTGKGVNGFARRRNRHSRWRWERIHVDHHFGVVVARRYS